jgi:hypothetical protein
VPATIRALAEGGPALESDPRLARPARERLRRHWPTALA